MTFWTWRLIYWWDDRGFGCWQAHQGLPVGFLLLWYSVLCTVESLSLLYLLFISWFICSRRWCMDKWGVFHANQNLCLDPHLNRGWGWRCETGLSPPVKYFYWPFQGGTSFVDHLCYYVSWLYSFVSVHCCLVVTYWERADLLALVYDVYCGFVTFPCCILGQVWYLIASIPDLCHLSYF